MAPRGSVRSGSGGCRGQATAPARLGTSGQSSSNSSAFTPAIKAAHSFVVNRSTGLLGSLESRTKTSVITNPTSTQFAFPAPEKELFLKVAPGLPNVLIWISSQLFWLRIADRSHARPPGCLESWLYG